MVAGKDFSFGDRVWKVHREEIAHRLLHAHSALLRAHFIPLFLFAQATINIFLELVILLT
jgi:hypothetical protein